MKKLIMFVTTVAALAVSQAATVTWSSGSLLKGPQNAYMAAGDIKMYVFEFANADAYAAADISSLDVSTAKLSGATTKSTAGITLTDSTSYGAGDTIYSAVIFTASDSGTDYIMGAKFTETVDALGGDVTFASLKNNVGSWTQAGGSSGGVPEPTSALLLVLGGAMLALRRKQK